jgi:hypothetical protein
VADPAILSVVFTGTVGVLGAATATTGHFVTLRNEERKRREARREDLRAVLDDAVKLAMEFERSFDEEQTVGDLLKHLNVLVTRGPVQLGRIGVRLGPDSDEYGAYARFVEAVTAVGAGLEQMPRNTMMSDEAVRAAVRELGSETTAEVASALDMAQSESKVALKQFMVAAHSRVGANV